MKFVSCCLSSRWQRKAAPHIYLCLRSRNRTGAPGSEEGAESTEKAPMPEGRSRREERADAMINGGLIALSTVAIVDNMAAHWLLDLHRVVPGPHALAVEIALVVAGAGMLTVGILREKRARMQEKP